MESTNTCDLSKPSKKKKNKKKTPTKEARTHEHKVESNVFRTGPVIEPEKLLVHGSPVEPVVEPRSNRWRHKYVIYILLKLKIIIKILKYIWLYQINILNFIKWNVYNI